MNNLSSKSGAFDMTLAFLIIALNVVLIVTAIGMLLALVGAIG